MAQRMRTARSETAWQLQRCTLLDQDIDRRREALRREREAQRRAMRREASHLESLSHLRTHRR